MSGLKRVGLLLTVVLMLPLAVACGDDSPPPPATGGSGGAMGTGGTGGTSNGDPAAQTINNLCSRFDDCNSLPDFFAAFGLPPGSATECVDVLNVCIDDNFALPSLRQDWATLTDNCLGFATCAVVFDCWLNNGLAC